VLKPFATGAQALPQAPQFDGSKVVSVHTPKHNEKVDGQGAWQAPAAQKVPGGHTVPQLPQF